MGDDALQKTWPLKLEAVLYALSDPVRLHIVNSLAKRGELACYAAVAGLEIAKSTQSHHYRILREVRHNRAAQRGRVFHLHAPQGGHR